MPPTLLSPRELAERLDSGYGDVLSWARRGLIPSIKTGGRYYFDLTKVVRALHERQGATASKAEATDAKASALDDETPAVVD
jgi:excisionase family DNA binding protein